MTMPAPETVKRGRPRKVAAGRADTSAAILDAAEDLFSKHGLHGVTMREVARKASVDQALLHYYFGTKRGLFDAMFLRRAKPINEIRLRALDDYVRAHLSHDIGVTDMARAAGYSPVHFARLFRKAVGVPPYRYLQERRVEAVRNALYSPARLADIAIATGFCNQEHMTRVFREFHGITPGRYRRLQTGRRSV